MTCYLVGGTQASRPKDNAIVVIKMSNMKKTYKEEERDDDEDASTCCTSQRETRVIRLVTFGRLLICTASQLGLLTFRLSLFPKVTPMTATTKSCPPWTPFTFSTTAASIEFE